MASEKREFRGELPVCKFPNADKRQHSCLQLHEIAQQLLGTNNIISFLDFYWFVLKGGIRSVVFVRIGV